ncbi:hypothetical protein BDZ97DRAFT_2046778 [Flammula alnicola]|nr:hypothetical protein BDZ97DRAFT_2046778 [Flammula alnicola]
MKTSYLAISRRNVFGHNAGCPPFTPCTAKTADSLVSFKTRFSAGSKRLKATMDRCKADSERRSRTLQFESNLISVPFTLFMGLSFTSPTQSLQHWTQQTNTFQFHSHSQRPSARKLDYRPYLRIDRPFVWKLGGRFTIGITEWCYRHSTTRVLGVAVSTLTNRSPSMMRNTFALLNGTDLDCVRIAICMSARTATVPGTCVGHIGEHAVMVELICDYVVISHCQRSMLALNDRRCDMSPCFLSAAEPRMQAWTIIATSATATSERRQLQDHLENGVYLVTNVFLDPRKGAAIAGISDKSMARAFIPKILLGSSAYRPI